MNRYIDAEWLLNFFEPYPNDYQTPLGSLRACVDDAPSIEIIPCVECRYKGMEICPMYKLTKAGVLKPYDFCSYGERREP